MGAVGRSSSFVINFLRDQIQVLDVSIRVVWSEKSPYCRNYRFCVMMIPLILHELATWWCIML